MAWLIAKLKIMIPFPPEGIQQGTSVLFPHLHGLLSFCWTEGEIPQSMHDAKMSLYLRIKVIAVIVTTIVESPSWASSAKCLHNVLGRLQILADCIYPESQCDFRSGRSTVDMIFSVRQLQEKCREQQPIYLAFVDLTKAFDLVNRIRLFKLLEKMDCPPKLLSTIASFHVNMHGTASFDGEIYEPFRLTVE